MLTIALLFDFTVTSPAYVVQWSRPKSRHLVLYQIKLNQIY